MAVTPATIDDVLKGPKTDEIAQDRATCAAVEVERNGGPIHWSAHQNVDGAARLAHCIDPHKWPDSRYYGAGDVPEDLKRSIEALEWFFSKRIFRYLDEPPLGLWVFAAILGPRAPYSLRAFIQQKCDDEDMKGLGDWLAQRPYCGNYRLCLADDGSAAKVMHVEAASPVVHAIAEHGVTADPNATQRPLQRQRFQEEQILQVILDELRLDPLALPARTPGIPGTKSQVRKILAKQDKGTWRGRVFEKAWERLRAQGDIKEDQ